jgi:hypothetical protein
LEVNVMPMSAETRQRFEAEKAGGLRSKLLNEVNILGDAGGVGKKVSGEVVGGCKWTSSGCGG